MSSSQEELVAWLTEHAARLRVLPPEDAADEIGDRVVALDPRLGVEVGHPLPGEDGPRELVLTAFSDRAAFPLVRALAQSIGELPGWMIVAFKQAAGFDFTVTVGDSELLASTLEFVPGEDETIRLLVPAALFDRIEPEDRLELGWLIVEAGIGEELATTIGGVELSRRGEGEPGWPMTALGAFLAERHHRDGS